MISLKNYLQDQKKDIVTIREKEIEIANAITFFADQYYSRKDVNNLLLEMEAKKIRFECEINYISYNMIVFIKKLAYYYMNTGLHENVLSARKLIVKAIKIFEIGNFYSAEQYTTYFQLRLLESLSYEFFCEHNIAFTGYESSLNEIEKKYPFVDEITKNLFRRLMYIISSEDVLKRELENFSPNTDIFASYQNKRRILEKQIYSGKAKEAKVLELNEMFEKIKNGLDKIYYVTHYRLMYMYYAMRKEKKVASMYFKMAINMAHEYEFSGQVDRLSVLRDLFE